MVKAEMSVCVCVCVCEGVPLCVKELLKNEKAYQGTKHRFGISVFQRLLSTTSVFDFFHLRA